MGCNVYDRSDCPYLQYRCSFLSDDNYDCSEIYNLTYLIFSAHVQFFAVVTLILPLLSARLQTRYGFLSHNFIRYE